MSQAASVSVYRRSGEELGSVITDCFHPRRKDGLQLLHGGLCLHEPVTDGRQLRPQNNIQQNKSRETSNNNNNWEMEACLSCWRFTLKLWKKVSANAKQRILLNAYSQNSDF